MQKIIPKKIPQYIDRLPPCNAACPAGENIQAWLNLAQKGNFNAAWEMIVKDNPFPAIHGRVCYHPCEHACNRSQYDNTVSIHCIERFIGDMALEHNWAFPETKPATGKKILISGAGPAGLSCAYHLRRLGHEIVVYEKESYLGGLMFAAIPDYRLPQNILNGEINRLINYGVKIELNRTFTIKDKDNFDAVFLAAGAANDILVHFKKTGSMPILGTVELLRKLKLQSIDPTSFGKSAIVYGGGNSAIDVARTLKRYGVADVNIIFRRDRKHMKALDHEVAEAEAERVNFIFLRTIKEVDDNKLKLEFMHLNAAGRAEGENRFEFIKADLLVLALGQTPNVDYLTIDNDNLVIIDAKMMTSEANIFAGGDLVTNNRSVTTSVGHGKNAAFHIDAHLANQVIPEKMKNEAAEFEHLHIDKADNREKTSSISPKILSREERVNDFREIVKGIDENQATIEAKRCFSCGNCFECDGCYNICPVKCIDKMGVDKRYKIDLNKCIGCSKCYQHCPCGAIKMVTRQP